MRPNLKDEIIGDFSEKQNAFYFGRIPFGFDIDIDIVIFWRNDKCAVTSKYVLFQQ